LHLAHAQEVPLRTVQCTHVLPDMSLGAVAVKAAQDISQPCGEDTMFHKTFGRSLLAGACVCCM